MRWLVGAVVLASTACFAGYGLHESAVAHNREGIERLAGGDLEGAAAAFRLALEYNARFSEPYNNLALVAIRRHDFAAAEQHLRHALLLNQDFAEAWTNLGFVRLRQGDAAEAVEAFEEALAIDPGQLDARFDLVLALVEAERVDEAWEHVLRLDVASADDPGVQGLAAWVAARRERCDEALGWSSRALSTEPAEPLANLAAGTCLLERGATAKAVPYLRAAASGDVGAPAELSLGLALLALTQWSEARTVLEGVLEEQPELAMALAGVGVAAAAQRDLEPARRMLERALAVGGEGAGALSDSVRGVVAAMLAALPTVDSPPGAE